MIQDFCKIRKGTDSKYALDKALEIVTRYILFNSRDFKVESTIDINLQLRNTRNWYKVIKW